MYAEIYTNLPEIQEKYLKFNIRFIDRSGPKWGHYIKGVMKNYYGRLHAFKAVIVSSVPMGGGLSSSAALEVSAYMFFDELNGKHRFSTFCIMVNRSANNTNYTTPTYLFT